MAFERTPVAFICTRKYHDNQYDILYVSLNIYQIGIISSSMSGDVRFVFKLIIFV